MVGLLFFRVLQYYSSLEASQNGSSISKKRIPGCILTYKPYTRRRCSYQRAAGVEDGFDGGVAYRVAAAGGVNALLLLTAVAEPDPDHLLLHVELVGDHGDLLGCRLLVLLKQDKDARDAM